MSEMAGDTGRPPNLIPVLSLGTVQKKAYTGTAAAIDNAVGGKGRTIVWVLCTTDAHVRKGSAPTAVATDTLIPAMTLIHIWVDGGIDKLSFIRDAVNGDAYVTEAP